MKALAALLRRLFNDEHGFIVSAELVLVGTIGVLTMVVGLSAVSHAVSNELYDLADAFESLNQDDQSDSYNPYDGYGRGTGHRYAGGPQTSRTDIVAQ